MANTVPLTLWALLFAAVAAVLLGMATGGETKNPIAAALETLQGEEEKTEFLAYFLAIGLQEWAASQPRPPKFLIFTKPETFTKTLNISRESIERFESMNIPKESTTKLLEWTKSEFNLSTRNVLQLVKRKKCGGPICLPDIGELCCPW